LNIKASAVTGAGIEAIREALVEVAREGEAGPVKSAA
jgi:hypothetical protein